MRKGLTLIELIITVVMIVILTGVTAFIFRAILLSWSGEETRAGIDIGLDRGIEEMVRDLRMAKAIQSTANYNEIRFTIADASDPDDADEDSDDNHYIYYLYNENDSYVPPPAFDQDTYELRKATLTGGISGTFDYDSGRIIISDVLPPSTSDLSSYLYAPYKSIIVYITLSVKRKDETISSKTQVRPRNYLW